MKVIERSAQGLGKPLFFASLILEVMTKANYWQSEEKTIITKWPEIAVNIGVENGEQIVVDMKTISGEICEIIMANKFYALQPNFLQKFCELSRESSQNILNYDGFFAQAFESLQNGSFQSKIDTFLSYFNRLLVSENQNARNLSPFASQFQRLFCDLLTTYKCEVGKMQNLRSKVNKNEELCSKLSTFCAIKAQTFVIRQNKIQMNALKKILIDWFSRMNWDTFKADIANSIEQIPIDPLMRKQDISKTKQTALSQMKVPIVNKKREFEMVVNRFDGGRRYKRQKRQINLQLFRTNHLAAIFAFLVASAFFFVNYGRPTGQATQDLLRALFFIVMALLVAAQWISDVRAQHRQLIYKQLIQDQFDQIKQQQREFAALLRKYEQERQKSRTQMPTARDQSDRHSRRSSEASTSTTSVRNALIASSDEFLSTVPAYVYADNEKDHDFVEITLETTKQQQEKDHFPSLELTNRESGNSNQDKSTLPLFAKHITKDREKEKRQRI